MDVLLLSVILLCAAAVCAAFSMAAAAQRGIFHHVEAGLLAQQYLNEMEYDLEHGTHFASSETDTVENNGVEFIIEHRAQRAEEEEHLYYLTVKVEWLYEGAEQSEWQQREIICR